MDPHSKAAKPFISLAASIDRMVGWDKLPTPLGLLVLAGIRDRLRRDNLYDSGAVPPADPEAPADGVAFRTIDGRYNDVKNPAMGARGARFGRNVPLRHAFPESESQRMEPNPRLVSRELLTRDRFVPATTLNALAAAWIQFEVHDWFSHGKPDWDAAYELPLQDDDEWPTRPLRIPRGRSDPSWVDDGKTPPTYVTTDSHWWDGSQVYGSDPEFAQRLRAGEDGKLRIGEDGLPPRDLEAGLDLSDVAGNFWVGLGLLHILFMREHNAICDALRRAHPKMNDEALYRTARLVNVALMAKIHTVEWTPAIIAHPTSKAAMRANWWGLAGEKVKRRYGRLGKGDIVSGIMGGHTDHFGVPFSLTEEFTAVYRMHPLIPDDYTFRSVEDDQVLAERTFPELNALHTRTHFEELGMPNSLYSFGVAHPGAITLHNYPRFMQVLERPDGTILDLAATDILRIRERGIPRYNQFRRLLHLKPAGSFAEVTPNPTWRRELQRVYRSVDRMDLMVGLFAEPPPKGFGFSDTAFRVFVLMASRRLNSDRFFTADYRPEVYTPTGMRWVDDNTLISVLLRHYPELRPALENRDNAFVPWQRTGRGR